MSTEEQQQQQQKEPKSTTPTTGGGQQESSVTTTTTTPATSAIKNNVKRVSIKGTPSRVKIAAPYAYVEVIELMLFWHVHAVFKVKLFIQNICKHIHYEIDKMFGRAKFSTIKRPIYLLKNLISFFQTALKFRLGHRYFIEQ